MKKARMVLSLFVTLVVALGLGSQAFADDPPTTGNITIYPIESGTTYNIYRVLDVTLVDTDPTKAGYESERYALNSKWASFFQSGNPGAAYLATTNITGNLNDITVGGQHYYLNITQESRVQFANDAMKWALGNNGTEYDYQITGGTETSSTITEAPLGYYLMIPLDASIKTGSYAAVAALDTSNPDLKLNVKAGQPTLEKTDDKVSADIGSTVRYTVKGKVPDASGYPDYSYTVMDQMIGGLVLNKDVTVTIAGIAEPVTTYCTIAYSNDGKSFTASIPVKNNYSDYVGSDIEITYTATLTAEAANQLHVRNSVSLEYGSTAVGNLRTTTPVSEEVYTSNIVINKYSGTDPAAANAKLAGAKFVLMNSEGKYYRNTNGKIEWHTVANALTSGATDSVTDSEITALATAANATTITARVSNAQGSATFEGVADGDYYLVEIAAPAGYNRLHTVQKVSVAGKDADGDDPSKVDGTADATGLFDEKIDSVANVQNNMGNELPETGGIGTTVFYVAGTILLVGAAIGILVRRKARE